jgi:hypothetical protein
LQQQHKPGVLFWLALGAAAAMVVGGFGPWATVLGFSAAGTEGDGWIVIVIGVVVAAGLAALNRSRVIGSGAAISLLLAGGLVAGIAVYDITNIERVAEGTFLEDAISPGWGLYMVLAAGIVLLGTAVAVLAGKPMFESLPGRLFGPQAAGPPQPPPAPGASPPSGPEHPRAG